MEMSPWVDAGNWVQEKFEELEKQRPEEIIVIFDKGDFQRLGIKASVTFGRDAEKAVLFAKEWARKGYKVLLVSPTESGFLVGKLSLTVFFISAKDRRMEMKVKLKCPRCGAVTYKPSLEDLLREVEKLWEPWREYLTIEQRKKLEEYNNFARLEATLAKEGYIRMFCPICIFQLTLSIAKGS